MAETPENVIEVRGLVTHYGERMILKGVDFDVREGEIMVIMGGSGSGKSTLLRHLLSLEYPTSGTIRLLGKDVAGLSIRERVDLAKKIGAAFQSGALFSSLSVAENIMLPLQEHTKLDPATMQIMTRMKLQVVDLAGFEDLKPSELSGGMIKRAAMGRAIIMDPRILFCDEPSAGLGMSIVVVTHELDSAFAIADRMTVLDQGEILFCGTPDELRSSKNTRIQNLLNRRAEEELLDPDEYLQRLTGMKVRESVPI